MDGIINKRKEKNVVRYNKPRKKEGTEMLMSKGGWKDTFLLNLRLVRGSVTQGCPFFVNE